MSADPTVVHLFCGAGGGGLGFARAGFRSLAAIDSDPAACRDYERLVGSPATCADPRLGCMPSHAGHIGVEGWDDAARTIRADHRVQNAPAAVADPRVGCRRREGGHGVKGWGQPSAPIIGHASIDNFPAQVADPRMGCRPRAGTMGVENWAAPSHAVIGQHVIGKGPASVADPRAPELVGPAIDLGSKRPTWIVIRAADGTWHRPMTTLELAALQGFPTRIDGGWLELGGGVQSTARELIGNAVPPPTAEAIARNCIATLAAAADGFVLSSEAIWVRKGSEAWLDA